MLGNGEVLRASPDTASELFYGTVGACGSLGVTTLFEVQLQKSAKFVELAYLPVSDSAHAIELLKRVVKEGHEFVDAILFANDRGTVVVGNLVDETPFQTVRFTRPWDPWFYLHADAVGSDPNKAPHVDAVPIFDYMFRYDRGAFWMGSYSFYQWWNPFNRFMRFLWDPFMHTRDLYRAMHLNGASQSQIIQDIAMPFQTAKIFLDYIEMKFNIWPIWLCPFRGGSQAPVHKWNGEAEFILNVGVWGPGNQDFTEFVKDNRDVERKVGQLQGKKWLYGHMYYTPEEFWQIYDKDKYDALRKKYHADYLPNLYDKTKSTGKKQHWGLGLWDILLGPKKDYLLSKV